MASAAFAAPRIHTPALESASAPERHAAVAPTDGAMVQ